MATEKKCYKELWRGENRLWYVRAGEDIAPPEGMTEITQDQFCAEKARLYALKVANPSNERYKWQQVFPLRIWKGHDVDYRTPPMDDFKVAVDPPIRYHQVGYGASACVGDLAEEWWNGYDDTGITITGCEQYTEDGSFSDIYGDGLIVCSLSNGTSRLSDSADSYIAEGDLTKYPAIEFDNEKCDYLKIGYNGHRYPIKWVEKGE